MSWLLLQLASLDDACTWLFTCLALATAMRNTLEGASRIHEKLEWRPNVEACFNSPNPFSIPLHFAGELNNLMQVELKPEQCRKLVVNSLIDNKVTQ